MKISYDENKSLRNIALRQLSFAKVVDFDWERAIVREDVRFNYSEQRYVAYGYLEERLHCLCFTPVYDGIRVISFRKANKREIRDYEQTINK
ncbi:BrnT family toxin [Conservatibacter flavescens]|uniref:BrnT family toxin n=1 Tax=Conservatibacter flavescens TaxID=28161 RepID=A0A2M8S5V7_9PAST|nr:BrnT family toxin [Conservatibacter flavescens]PJG86526.1 hypothetical protein CVP05_01595 [Conservatibacter flavescens]